MLTLEETMNELQAMGDENVKKIWMKHGIKEPFFGVKIENLKKLQKKIKINHQLAKDLYATGNADAMYLAGLIADDDKMTKADLEEWVKQAESSNINDYTVPWVASQGRYGYELAMQWIDDPEPQIATAGWATLNCHLALTPDDQLNMPALKKVLEQVVQTIHIADSRVRLKMNSFVIALGSYVAPLTEDALAAAKNIGLVKATVNGTACKVPDAMTSIMKVKDKELVGKKKKEVKC